jgi:hypothetical protein
MHPQFVFLGGIYVDKERRLDASSVETVTFKA